MFTLVTTHQASSLTRSLARITPSYFDFHKANSNWQNLVAHLMFESGVSEWLNKPVLYQTTYGMYLA